MQVASTLLTLFSVLVPARLWVSPSEPLMVANKAQAPVSFVLTDFAGKVLDTRLGTEVAPGQEVDLKTMYPITSMVGTYVLFAVPKAKPLTDFVGTPLVISVRSEKRGPTGGGTAVTRIEPLRYAVLTINNKPATVAFYYDVAPHTVNVFQTLAEQGYYDGLIFHRIVADSLLQGGDPRGDGTGGPGFHVEAEFSDRKHVSGVLSMARLGDPLEPQMRPRAEYANSAGSQFFVCLSDAMAATLDGRYTAFGKVVQGLEDLLALGKLPIVNNAKDGRPVNPPVIQSITIKPVTPQDNPYPAIMARWPSTRPAQEDQ